MADETSTPSATTTDPCKPTESHKCSCESHKRVIMIPVDESKFCEHAFNWYLEHCRQDGDLVIILHVIEPVMSMSPVGYGLFNQIALPDYGKGVMQYSIDGAKKLCKKFVSRLKQNGVHYDAYLHLDVKPGSAIINSAKLHNASMIIIGSRGMGRIKRALIGSVSDYVVHHSNLPTIVIPPPANDEQEEEKPKQ